MAKEGFQRNYGAIAGILKNDASLKAAVKAAAEGIAAEVGGDIKEYETDRFVAGVKKFYTVSVEGHRQARDGVLTKALGRRGKTLS